jgi:hypothetical protein
MARRRKSRRRNPGGFTRSGYIELGAWVASVISFALLPQPLGSRLGGAALIGAGVNGLVAGEQSKWIGALFVAWGASAAITPEILAGMRGGLPERLTVGGGAIR